MEDLDERDALLDQARLPGVDLGVARLPHIAEHQVVHPDNQDVLVVAAVEHPERADGRQRLVETPQEVVRPLVFRRPPEGRDAHPRRVDQPDDL